MAHCRSGRRGMNHLRDVLARAWWVAGSRMPSAVMKCSAGWCPARIIEPVSKLDSLRVLERQVPRLPAAGKPSWSQWCSDAISPVAR